MLGKRYHYKFSFKTKMVIGFLSVSLLAVILMAILSHSYYSNATKEDFFTISKQATDSLNHQTEFYLQQLSQSTATLIVTDEIQQWLTEKGLYSFSYIREIEEELQRYVALNHDEVSSMLLMSLDKRIISITGNSFTGKPLYESNPWYNIPFSTEMMILPTRRSVYSSSYGDPIISVAIPIYSKKDLNVIGRLIIELTLREIENIFGQSKLGETGSFFIVSSDDKIVYHPNKKWMGLDRDQTGLASLQFTKETSVQQWQGKEVLVTYTPSVITNWYTVALVPYDEMANGLNIARNSTTIVVVFLALGIIMIVPVLSNRFVQPIRNLKGLMHKVEEGNLKVKAEAHPGKDEVQQLNKGFNRMTERLQQLVETVSSLRLKEVHIRLRQKEALIQALQNQINPHFLYNTLDIMKSIAYLERVPMIETMAGNLADVFRYTARISDAEVTLQDELTHLKKYLEIVHIRFPKNFQSYLYVNDKYISCSIMKLTIQPIVENAVKYAVEASGGKGMIVVSAYSNKEDLVIEIADNGSGISQEKLEELNDKLTYISQHINDEYVDEESLGIPNVHARLVLKYGHQYGLSVNSFADRGTVVSIRIPFRKVV
jgi:two-component system sensor histidine kinase YesM